MQCDRNNEAAPIANNGGSNLVASVFQELPVPERLIAASQSVSQSVSVIVLLPLQLPLCI